MSQKQEWGSRLGVILAVAGSAVGLGNFLRFPGQVAQNGGGAFMIPYFCALLLLGIPIGWAEWSMARYGGRKGFHSAPGIMGVVGRGALPRYLGIIGVLIPLAVYFYYVLIESWCLGYCFEYLMGMFEPGPALGAVPAAAREHFDGFTGQVADGALFTFGTEDAQGLHKTSLAFWVLTFALNFVLLYRGLSKGIETFCKFAMPVMALAGLVVLVKVLTLGTPDPAKPDQSVSAGLGFMWNPQFDKILDFNAWLAAAGQIFFSLSVGFGVIINYASYLKKKDDVVLSGLTSSATNEFFEVGLGGLITVPAAFVFLGAVGTAEAVRTGSFGLGFKTLPVVFASMGGVGDFIGFVWFFMLFLAAITSSLSMLQPALAFLEEALGVDRKKATLGLLLLGCLGNLFVLYYSRDLTALDTIDFWVGTFLIFVLAAVQVICFGWRFGIDRGLAEAHHGAQIRIPRIYRGIIKYVAPLYLIVVFVGFSVQNLPGYVRGMGGAVDASDLAAPALLERIRADADGDGWFVASEMRDASLTRAALDAAAPSRPVAVFSEDRKSAWINRAAAEKIAASSGSTPAGIADGPLIAGDYAAAESASGLVYASRAKVTRRSLAVIGVLIVGLLVATRIGERRWRAEGRDLDGERPPEDEVSPVPPRAR